MSFYNYGIKSGALFLYVVAIVFDYTSFVSQKCNESQGWSKPDMNGREIDRELDASESQVVREVMIQIKALLNDPGRTRDAGIWKAILCEPPADQLPLRREIGRQLEPQLRPMAENGSFATPVVRFLAEWFDWHSLQDVVAPEDERNYPEPDTAEEGVDSDSPQMVNFWPAVIGWVIGLVILAILFGGMSGG
tara:strand:- start:1252 stop:1827 length:576 start_codon:yes stop_codon:yes gene_type:complete